MPHYTDVRCNEDEFGQWRPVCDRFRADYIKACFSYPQVSALEEDLEGRLDLNKLWLQDRIVFDDTQPEQKIPYSCICAFQRESDA